MIGFGIAIAEITPFLARDKINADRKSLKAAWQNILQRCNRAHHPIYRHYGGRGIKCTFKSFEEFEEAIGTRPSEDHSVDRINVDGNYEPGNIRWATQSEQNRNRRDTAWVIIEGVRYKRVDLADRYGITSDRIDYGVKKRWSFSKITSKEKQWDTSSLPLAVKAASESRRKKRKL